MPLFKAYDVRGVVPEELNEEIAYRIGKATAEFMDAEKIVVGRDMRATSGPLSKALCRGITDTGADVIWIGQCTSPMCYFAVGKYGYGGGVMVTASHNPAKYNGMKFCRKGAVPVGGDSGLKQIERRVEELALGVPHGPLGKGRRKGTIVHKDILEDYVRHVLSFARGIKTFRIVIDSGNGMTGKFLPAIFKHLPLKVKKMYFKPDGSFPHHEADPLKDENILDLQREVLAQKPDLGIALDGDGDRVAFVDENGRRVPNDLISALIAREMLSDKKNRGASVVYDLRSSWVVAEEIHKQGGVPLESRVGHSFIKALMRKHNAIFGGEVSGHYYYKDNVFADSADMTWVKILNILTKENRPFSQVVAPLRRYHATGEINFHVKDKDSVMRRLREKYADGKISEKDGISVHYKDWWFNVRASNTEPVLRLNLEAKKEEQKITRQAELRRILESNPKFPRSPS